MGIHKGGYTSPPIPSGAARIQRTERVACMRPLQGLFRQPLEGLASRGESQTRKPNRQVKADSVGGHATKKLPPQGSVEKPPPRSELSTAVIPAHAGIQSRCGSRRPGISCSHRPDGRRRRAKSKRQSPWIPACAGMTSKAAFTVGTAPPRGCSAPCGCPL